MVFEFKIGDVDNISNDDYYDTISTKPKGTFQCERTEKIIASASDFHFYSEFRTKIIRNSYMRLKKLVLSLRQCLMPNIHKIIEFPFVCSFPLFSVTL